MNWSFRECYVCVSPHVYTHACTCSKEASNECVSLLPSTLLLEMASLTDPVPHLLDKTTGSLSGFRSLCLCPSGAGITKPQDSP